MAGFEDRARALAATAARIARLQNAEPEATVLEQSSPTLLQTGSANNFDGTIDLFTLMLEIPISTYAALDSRPLRTMDALSAIITPDFLASSWCDQEVGIAFGRGKLVVPLRKGADPHIFLGKYQGFQTKGLAASAVAENLVDILTVHALSAQRMADALVERMATSRTWDSSKRTIALLEKAPRLNDSQVAKLVQSIETNTHVRDAFSVPDRIRKLVSRIGKAQ